MDMDNIDRRGRLDEEVFSYKTNKDNKVFIFWNGRQIMILKGSESERFIKRIKAADPREAQLIMAKATGNFKHGNER
ncbi:MAG TPA: hypothetical protein VN580_04540 [Clostridia bacterium]|nr:hypothetical protein [Clostridia bacterium]